MAIPNIVPRNNNDGETLGTQTKQFSNVFAKDVTVNDVSLNTKLSTLTTGVANNNTAIATLESTKLNTSTYTSKLNSVDSEISALSTTVSGKVDTSTYNTKMTSLDGSISELSSGKVNKSGDTFGGSGNKDFKNNENNSAIIIRGGTDVGKGGQIVIYGKDAPNYAGYVRIIANNGTTYSSIDIAPSGASVDTPATTDNSTKIATTAFVKGQRYLRSVPLYNANTDRTVLENRKTAIKYVMDTYSIVSDNYNNGFFFVIRYTNGYYLTYIVSYATGTGMQIIEFYSYNSQISYFEYNTSTKALIKIN